VIDAASTDGKPTGSLLDCAYFYVSDLPESQRNPVASTVAFSQEILVDLDFDGIPVGIELLDSTMCVPVEALVAAFPDLQPIAGILKSV
jgi:uncharacterized protein YuzE